jgi:putative tricarboxylic transport membrane protein
LTRGTVSGRPDEPQKEAEQRGSVASEATVGNRSLLLKILPELVLLAISIYFFFVASNFESVAREGRLGPSFWPQAIAFGIAFCALATITLKVLAHKRPVEGATPDDRPHVVTDIDVGDIEGDDDVVYWPRVALAIGLVVAYPLATIFIGYPLATALLLITFIYLGGQRKWYVIPIGILGSLLFTYTFAGFVYISLPWGVGIFERLTALIHQLLGIY